jgi:DNA-binding SARP family transcriptional activator
MKAVTTSDSARTVPRAVPKDIRLSLIQDFEVRCDEEPVTIAPASQRLVSFVALHPKPVHRSYISGTLWPDSDEHHASACLRSALWRLPPIELVCSSATHLWLNPVVRVDLHRVVSYTMSVLRNQSANSSLMDLTHELMDIGDEILLGWYEDWVMVEREQFRQIRLQALDRIGEQLIKAGCWDEALQVGLAATRTEPLRESAHHLLVRVHLMQGNVAEAIRQYRLYAYLLKMEFNGRPSQALSDLVAPFLRSKPV